MNGTSTEEQLENLVRRRLEAMLEDYVLQRASKSSAEREMERISKEVKPWLEAHPEEQLIDGERGFVVFLQTRGGGETYDMTRMPDDLVLLLHHMGALSINTKAVAAQDGKEVSERTKPYKIPGKGTVALIIERK